MGVRKRRLGEETLERVLARFDHRSPELATDPFSIYAKLRERCPLHRSAAWDGFLGRGQPRPRRGSREEALDVTDRTPREAVDKMMMLGPPEAVVDRLEPFIGCGVTDIILFDLGLLCAAPDLSGRFRAALEARGHLTPRSA